MQSRMMSLAEAAVNIAVGYVLAIGASMLVLPAFGLAVSLDQAAGISAVFTLLSLARSYVLRRMFNRFRG